MSDAPGRSAPEDAAARYWQSHSVEEAALFGVHPMGGGGPLEVAYRHFLEVATFLAHVPLSPDMAVLELGCGAGRWGLSLAPRVARYVGVDISSGALEAASAAARQRGLQNATFVQCAAGDFEPERGFDVVYLSGISQYLSDTTLTGILARLQSSTRPGARLIDRSTVSLGARTSMVRGTYASIYRTREELSQLATAQGWCCYACCPSYRVLRLTRLWRRVPHWAVQSVENQGTWRGIVRALERLSALADEVAPRALEGGRMSHEFSFFRRTEAL